MLVVGQKVKVIDDDLEGVVKSVNTDSVEFESLEGFRYTYFHNQVVKQEDIVISELEIKDVSTSNVGRKTSKFPVFIDLHLVEVSTSDRFKTNHSKLEFQINKASEYINLAKRNHLPKFQLIHGVGRGKLREALISLVDKDQQLEWHDASLRDFGKGAIEVFFHPNW